MQHTLNYDNISDLVQLAIKEDIGKGDITSEIFVPKDSESEGIFLAKEDGIIAGLPVVKYVFSQIDNDLLFTSSIEEGSSVSKGTTIANVTGPTISMLSAERLVLNFLQRLSGIATLTNKFVEKVKGHKAQIMDTRKTTPGWRYLEKYAVKVGGGVNHRAGLYDQILVKDNHLEIIEKACKQNENIFTELVKKARKQTNDGVLIEVEVEDTEHIKDLVDAGVDIIMFDNMNPTEINTALDMTKEYEESHKASKSVLTEVSGNITLENVCAYAQTGIDRISIGMITHSAKALDISLDIV